MIQRYLRLSKEIEFELAEIGMIVAEGTGFSSSYKKTTPGSLELRGFGAILHDFYNGIENICERIANEIDGGLPKGEDWHWRLLESMNLELPKLRPALFTKDVVDQLDEYRRFRHVFRHMYGSHLDWRRIKPLLEKLDKVFSDIEREVQQFIGFLTEIGE